LSEYRTGVSASAAWTVVVGGVALAIGSAIEHPDYLSMPLAAFSLMFSVLFVGLPLAFGLVVIQVPFFEKALTEGQPLGAACRRSILANAVYASVLTLPLMAISWLMGNQPTLLALVWAGFILIACSLVTSGIWLALHIALRRRHA
jgi:hypothetical protein